MYFIIGCYVMSCNSATEIAWSHYMRFKMWDLVLSYEFPETFHVPGFFQVGHGLLIIPIHLIGSFSLSPLHLYLVCGEHTGAVVLWQPSHHPSGCCTLVVVKEGPPHMIVKHFGCTSIHIKRAIQMHHSFILAKMAFLVSPLKNEVYPH